MNTLFDSIMRCLIDLDPSTIWLVKLTLTLATVWLLHAALARANPRWRVFLWRGSALCIAVLFSFALAGQFVSLTIPLALLPAEESPTAGPTDSLASSSAQPVMADAAIVGDSSIPLGALDAPNSKDSGRIGPGSSVDAGNSPAPATPASGLFRLIKTLAPKSSSGYFAAMAGVIWAVGVVLGAVAEGMAITRFAALRRRASRANGAIANQTKVLADRIGCHAKIEVLFTPDIATPCVVGVWRPAILLPDQSDRDASADERTAVLAHEIQHVKNGDLAWNAVLRIVERVLWFHPLAWRMRVAHAGACDAVCDAEAANLLGDVTAYCRVLARLALRAAAPLPAAGLAMARPSSARRRIEALQRKLHVARLPRVQKIVTVLFALAATGVLGAAAITRAEPGASSDANNVESAKQETPGAKIQGAVHDEAGEPIKGAIVQVYSAGVRVGTSPYCPTCYPDCGKRVKTDDEGRFRLTGLDPTLLFRLVVLARGYRPQFIKGVDTALGAEVKAVLAARRVPDDASRVVRGVVVDHAGKPIAGAMVEPFGCSAGGRRWWGSMPKVDPMVFTDADGQFTIVCDEPVIGLDLRVEARAAARKIFELIRSGDELHRLQLEVGSTVEGRVVRDGRGVPGVSIGIAQTDRSSGLFLGPYQIGTDVDGRFSISNLPSSEELVVYGHMDSLRAVGAVVSKKFKSANNASTNIGDLPVMPGFRLQGRVALSDGKPVPSKTRLMFGRPEAWDSTFVEPDAEGRFAVDNIPGECISINASIPGYRLSDKNKTFEPLNGTSVEGVVDHSMNDLVILYEPGKVERLDYSTNAKWQRLAARHNILKTEPLAGVTDKLEAFPADVQEDVDPATPQPYKPKTYPKLPKIEIPTPAPSPATTDAGPTKTIQGVVQDAGGKPVAGASVVMPIQWLNAKKSLTVTMNCDDQGRFRFVVPVAWLPQDRIKQHSTIWAYATGHALGTANARAQLYDNEPDEVCTVKLPAASDLLFTVLTADGDPAVGAKVNPLHLRTWQAFDLIPPELIERLTVTTDAAGRAKTPMLTRDDCYDVIVNHDGAGKQLFRIEMKSTTPADRKLQLSDVGRVEGRIIADQIELTRGMMVSLGTQGKYSEDATIILPSGSAMVDVDEQGRFTAPELAVGALSVDMVMDQRLPVRPRLPESNRLNVGAGESVKLDIPLEMCVRVHGVLRAKDTGLLFADKTVAVRYGAGRQGDHVTTNDKGEYSAFALAGKAYTQVITPPKGYAQLGAPWNEPFDIPQGVQEFELPVIEMVPTTRITGTLHDADGKPMANVQINGVVGNRRHGFGKTDDKGAFVLPDVPVGLKLESFGIWTRDDHFIGEPISTEPLVVRVRPAKPNP